MTPVKVWLGYPYPLGATWLGNGVNFAIFSETAASVDLCLFESPEARQENIRIPMTEHTDQVWHVFLPDVRPGQLYGIVSSDLTTRSAVCVSTVPSCSSTPMPRPSPAGSIGPT